MYQKMALYPLGLDLQTVMSCHVGAGNWTQVPCKNSLSTEPSLQPKSYWYLKANFVPCHTLLKLFIVSRNLMMDFLRFLVYNIMSYINKDNLTSFPICIPLIFSPALLFHLMLPALYWKGVGTVNSLVLFFILIGLLWVFSSFKIMLAVGLSHPTFIMLRYVHSSIVFSRTFIMKALDFFSQALFFIYSDVISFLSLLIWFIVFTDLGMLGLPEILG